MELAGGAGREGMGMGWEDEAGARDTSESRLGASMGDGGVFSKVNEEGRTGVTEGSGRDLGSEWRRGGGKKVERPEL